jgi:hypothetical protein
MSATGVRFPSTFMDSRIGEREAAVLEVASHCTIVNPGHLNEHVIDLVAGLTYSEEQQTLRSRRVTEVDSDDSYPIQLDPEAEFHMFKASLEPSVQEGESVQQTIIKVLHEYAEYSSKRILIAISSPCTTGSATVPDTGKVLTTQSR